MTGNQHDYRWLRRPRPTARVLAFFACSRVPAPCGPRRGPPRLPRILNVRLDMAWDPGEHRHRLPSRDTDCGLPEGQTRRHSPTKFFGAQHLQGRLHPLPLHLACFRAYASTRPLPVAPQGSILGSRLTITQVGFAPTRLRDIAKPHCPLFRPIPCPLFRYRVTGMATAGAWSSHSQPGQPRSRWVARPGN